MYMYLKESIVVHDESTEYRVGISLLSHSFQSSSTVEDTGTKHNGERYRSHLVVVWEKGREEGGG